MKERPILLSALRVRALLAGTKTQTRRLVKPQPASDQQLRTVVGSSGFVYVMDNAPMLTYPEVRRVRWDCPYGQPGDRLWVRETWQGPLMSQKDWEAHYFSDEDESQKKFRTPAYCQYAADGGPAPEFTTLDDETVCRWKPSIHMPRWASRITLEVIGVRVERLQDISNDDAKAEGCEHHDPCDHVRQSCADIDCQGPDYRVGYRQLWEQINGPSSWNANPWVWVVEFKRLAHEGAAA